mgnify:FL=1
MQELKLKRATYKDIGTISKLAGLIWNQHYPSIIGQKQIDYMLDLMYSPKSLKEQIQIKKHNFFLIEIDSSVVGFISVNSKKKGEWFLNKFYINQLKAKKGIGSKVFDLLLELTNPKKITLTVNRQNYKSINFYFKKGFKIEKVADFEIGKNYVMNDFVMAWRKKN